MSNAENNDCTHIDQYPEKTPGTFQSYMEIADYLEYSSNAIDALGDLMVSADEEKLPEYTIESLGFLLKMLGNNVLNKSFEVSKIAFTIPEEQRQNQPNASAKQHNIEGSQSRV